MRLGQGPGQHRIAGNQRLEDGAVLLLDHRYIATAGGLQPEQLTDFGLQAHLGVGQAQRLRSCRHFDMKAGIGAVPGQA
ncbi:hypothetical protein D3C76_1726300 [compost metagenome]